MAKNIVALVACTLLAGCATGFTFTPKEKFSLEQRAISSAISLCQKFGHKEDTKEFTRCAELRYDEYMINNR
tara:strand:+ start:744 stop:959 length:216 start_codon:yes stop_codon:yes gene_type:complete